MPTPPVFAKAVYTAARREGRPFDVARGDYLLVPDAARSPLYLIETGAAHACIQVASGTQTLRLGYPGEMLAALPGFYLGVPTPIGIQAIRRCAGYSIMLEQLRAAVAANPALTAAYTQMLEEFVCGHVARELDLLEPDPARRYANLLARSPHVFQHIPMRYIASYLRMAPETLSRLRKK